MQVVRDTVGAKFHDDFADGDFTNNPTWTKFSGADAGISSGQMKLANDASSATRYSSPLDSSVTRPFVFLCKWTGTSDARAWLGVAKDSTAQSGYTLDPNYTLAQLAIDKFTAGTPNSYTNLDVDNITALGTTQHLLMLVVESSDLKSYLDGTQVNLATNTDVTGSFTHAIVAQLNTGRYSLVDDVMVFSGAGSISCSRLPTGYKLKIISNSGGTVVTSATESSGTATIAASTVYGLTGWPYYGVIVTDANDVENARIVPSATVSGHSISGVFGGDAYTFYGDPARQVYARQAVTRAATR